MLIHSLDQDFKEQSSQVSKQAITAQFFGVLLLILPSFFLPLHFQRIGFIWGFAVLLYTAIFVGIWHRDFLFLYKKRIQPTRRLNQIRNSLGLLVFIDVVVISVLIGLMGGIAHSYLSGVLLLIPCVMSIIEIKPRVFVGISATIVIILFTSILSYAIADLDSFVIFCTSLGFFCDKSSAYAGYIYAVVCAAILSIILIVLEKYVIKPKLSRDSWTFNEIRYLRDHAYEPILAEYVNRAFRRYERCVDETNLSNPHISLVHSPQAVFSQAYILAYPSYQCSEIDDAINIAFVTFASHWIDDCFDAIYRKEILDDIRSKEKLQKLTFKIVCKQMQNSINIKNMVNDILECAKEEELVESGLFRVMLGGLIQHAPSDVKDDLVKLYRETYKNRGKLNKELAKKIDLLDADLLLATAHTSFGLILGCERSKDSQDKNQLDDIASIFDFILCPLVMFHDLPTEIRCEGGALPKCDFRFLDNLLDMAKLAVEKLPLFINQDTVFGHVRAKQLKIVRDLYFDLIPQSEVKFKEQYGQYLDEFIGLFDKGQPVM